MSSYNVKDLAEYMRRAKTENKPFVLFTGAGCSKSAGIPLAFELVEEINEKYALDLKALSDTEKRDYGRCMAALTKDDRRELLKNYIQKANINWAHIVQALLLEKGYIQRVLTFNFDNILSRSCGLLGLYPSIYDFTSANLDLLNLIIDPSIVHLHGQSHGFVQLNTDEETKQHAERLSQFVANTLSQSPSIFIGYSGNADAFFPLLKEKFSGQKRLFWVGRSEKAPKHVSENLIAPNSVAHYLHYEDADRFFIELAQELECFPPKAFDDPYGHLLDQLEPVLDFPTQQHNELDILASTRSMLKKSQEEREKSARPNFELLLMKGKYNELIELAKDIELKEEEKAFVAWAEIELGNELAEQARQEQQPGLFQKSCEKYQAALAIKPDTHEALNNWGNALSGLAELKQDPALFEQSFEKYQAALAIKPDKHDTLNNWGSALLELAQLKQEPALFEQSIEKYQAALAIKPDKHDALNNWGNALLDLARLTQEPVLFEQSFEKYQAALAIKPDTHDALYNWGIALSDLAELKQDPALFEQSFEKYQAALAIKPDKHDTLNNWGSALLELAQLKQEPALFEQSIEKYQAALAIKPDKHDALNNWGNALLCLAKLTQEPALFEQSVEKYQAALSIKPDDHEVLYNWGAALLYLAQLLNKPALFEEAKHKLLQARSISNQPSYNLACLYALLHDEVACKKELFDCHKAKTLPDESHLSRDTDLNFVRDKEWFKELFITLPESCC
ncbi:hypothetical protein AB3A53_000277 [Vibrio vulnificus]